MTLYTIMSPEEVFGDEGTPYHGNRSRDNATSGHPHGRGSPDRAHHQFKPVDYLNPSYQPGAVIDSWDTIGGMGDASKEE